MARSDHRFHLARIASALLLLGSALQGCASTTASLKTGLYAKPMGNAPVTRNETPYSQPLACLASYARANKVTPPRIAVGRIIDMTGRMDQITGTQLTQGASMFAMTALGKAGGRLVERYDTAVSEIELKYANAKLLSDTPEQAGQDSNNFRKVFAGQIAGSNYYIVGGITELNNNIHSRGFDGLGGASATTGFKGSLGRKVYVMNVAIDLRLVNSQSLEVVDMVSYQKQIVGTELSAGVFDFFHGNVVDLSAGNSGMEPSHLAVRALIERGVFEFSAKLYGMHDISECLKPELDPLNGGSSRPRP